MPSDAATLEELLQPLRDAAERSAVLLDVDGVLAPIVQQPDDAHMPETTRRPLIEVARRYGTVACVSGRRASDARRIVSLGSIAYLGSHGSEVLKPGSIAPELDQELQAWTRRVQHFAHDAFGENLRRLRVRLEDKEAIAVVIGTAFTALVNQTVESLITPLIAAIGGQPDFSALKFTINESAFLYGDFINAVVSFLIIAAVIYFLVVKPMNAFLAMRKQKDAPAEPEAPAEDVRLLTEIRDLLAERRA